MNQTAKGIFFFFDEFGDEPLEDDGIVDLSKKEIARVLGEDIDEESLSS